MGQLRGLIVDLSLLLDLLKSSGVEFGALLRFQGNCLLIELLAGKVLLSKSMYGLFGSRDRGRLTGISLLVVLLLLTEHELIVRHRHHFGVGLIIRIVRRAQLSLVQESGCLRDRRISILRLLLIVCNDLRLGLDQFLHLAVYAHAISLFLKFRVPILFIFRLLSQGR